MHFVSPQNNLSSGLNTILENKISKLNNPYINESLTSNTQATQATLNLQTVQSLGKNEKNQYLPHIGNYGYSINTGNENNTYNKIKNGSINKMLGTMMNIDSDINLITTSHITKNSNLKTLSNKNSTSNKFNFQNNNNMNSISNLFKRGSESIGGTKKMNYNIDETKFDTSTLTDKYNQLGEKQKSKPKFSHVRNTSMTNMSNLIGNSFLLYLIYLDEEKLDKEKSENKLNKIEKIDRFVYQGRTKNNFLLKSEVTLRDNMKFRSDKNIALGGSIPIFNKNTLPSLTKVNEY